MADTIPQHYTTEFYTNWIHRAQQLKSRLEGWAKWEMVKGERKRFDRTSAQVFRRRLERKAETIPVNPTLDFRWLLKAFYELVNDYDESDAENLGELILPTGAWVEDHAAAYSRLKDQVIVDAALGNAVTGEAGTSTTALPAGQMIAAGGTGLTVAKLRSARQILRESNLEGTRLPGQDSGPSSSNAVLVTTSEQITNLLSDPQVTSADYNTVRALVDGNVDTFMGFKFEVLDTQTGVQVGLPKVSTTRSCVAFIKGAIQATLGTIKTHIDIIPTQSHKTQVRSTCEAAANRLHDEAVVQIDCIETA